jgi:hypothetical protein
MCRTTRQLGLSKNYHGGWLKRNNENLAFVAMYKLPIKKWH